MTGEMGKILLILFGPAKNVEQRRELSTGRKSSRERQVDNVTKHISKMKKQNKIKRKQETKPEGTTIYHRQLMY